MITRFSRRPGVETQVLDSTSVIAVRDQHLYFAVNRVGTRIWWLLAEPRTVDELVATLAREFAIDEATCRQEAESFLQQLAEKKLVDRLVSA